MKIEELKDGLNAVETQGTIVEIGEPKKVTTKYGYDTTVSNAIMEDETGKILLVLWGEQSKGLEKGKQVKVTGGFVRRWKGATQISIGKSGKIEII